MAETTPDIPVEATMAMRVVGALRDEIVTMGLKPGDVISESDIAARYGVSRQPVREAFIRLAQQGLLLIRPKRATVIKKISPDGVRQSRFIRESIEVEIIRRVAAQPGPEAAGELAGLIAEQEVASAADDSRRFHALDELFHRTLARLAGVEYAWQLIEDHKIQLDRVRYLTLGVSSSQRAIAEHKSIAAAGRPGRRGRRRGGNAGASGAGGSAAEPDDQRFSRLLRIGGSAARSPCSCRRARA